MPFGEQIANTTGTRSDNSFKYAANEDDVRQKFTGYQQDGETMLDFAEARMYENRHARFTSVDPLLASGKSSNPQTFNRYVYVGNNPILRIDPNGEEWIVKTRTAKTKGGEYLEQYLVYVTKEQLKSTDTIAPNIWHGVEGFQALHPTERLASEIFDNPEDAQDAFDKWFPNANKTQNSISAGTSNSKGVGTLLFEFITGTGSQENQFGPDTSMTKGIRTSPALKYHFDIFRENGGGTYDSEIYANATGQYQPRFALGSGDGPLQAGLNLPRQFVGSFNISITENRNSNGQLTGDALVVVRNPTHFNSLAYGAGFNALGLQGPSSWNRRKENGVIDGYNSILNIMSRTDQTFWWVEEDLINRNNNDDIIRTNRYFQPTQ